MTWESRAPENRGMPQGGLGGSREREQSRGGSACSAAPFWSRLPLCARAHQHQGLPQSSPRTRLESFLQRLATRHRFKGFLAAEAPHPGLAAADLRLA